MKFFFGEVLFNVEVSCIGAIRVDIVTIEIGNLFGIIEFDVMKLLRCKMDRYGNVVVVLFGCYYKFYLGDEGDDEDVGFVFF